MITKEELESIRTKAPFLSEGAISPFQVSNMGKREKIEYDKNKQIRFTAEAEFKKQNRTEKEITDDNNFDINKKVDDLKSSIGSRKWTIDYLKELPAFKSKRMNNTRRGVLFAEDEIKKIELEIEELKRGLK